MGPYMMAKDNAEGYLRLMLGNERCASLMATEGYYMLTTRQLVPLGFATDGLLVRRNKPSH